MSTFYSILYVPIRPGQDEKVSIALFLSQGGESFFKYSLPKLNIIKPLLPPSAFSLLRSYLKNIESEIGARFLPGSEWDAIMSADRKTRFLEESYFEYLSRYSNNLLAFSKPKSLSLTANESIFAKLFEKYVFDLEESVVSVSKPTIIQRVRQELFPKISSHVNIDRHLTSQEIPNLFVPTDVHFIGRNDVPVAGHTFDFEKRLYNLEHDVASFVGLAKAFELNGEKNGQFYVIGNEPSRKDHPEQHKTWKTIHESDFLEFVPVEEMEKVDSYLREHEVEPYFEQDQQVP